MCRHRRSTVNRQWWPCLRHGGYQQHAAAPEIPDRGQWTHRTQERDSLWMPLLPAVVCVTLPTCTDATTEVNAAAVGPDDTHDGMAVHPSSSTVSDACLDGAPCACDDPMPSGAQLEHLHGKATDMPLDMEQLSRPLLLRTVHPRPATTRVALGTASPGSTRLGLEPDPQDRSPVQELSPPGSRAHHEPCAARLRGLGRRLSLIPAHAPPWDCGRPGSCFRPG